MKSWKSSDKMVIIAVVVVIGIFAIYSLANTFTKTIRVKDKTKVRQRSTYSTSHYYELTDQEGSKYEISLYLGNKIQPDTVIRVKGRKTLFGKPMIHEALPAA
jgi:hypothetical protein